VQRRARVRLAGEDVGRGVREEGPGEAEGGGASSLRETRKRRWKKRREKKVLVKKKKKKTRLQFQLFCLSDFTSRDGKANSKKIYK
jgi:hypothetical protein